jgi:polyisoprenoid-binding protein YceI
MKKLLITGLMLGCVTILVPGQGKYLTNEGNISFYSHTIIEDITATHNNVAGVIDAATGDVAIIVRMTGFQFEKKLMQEHFNENYVESEKFPKATFNGSITNNVDVKYSTPGTYQAQVKGNLTIHGVTRAISAEGSVEVTSAQIIARTKFLLNPEDYGMKIPKVVRKNIAEKMEIRVVLNCDPI